MDVTFNLSDVRFNIYLQIYMKKLSISTPWKEVKENEYKRISSFRPLPEVTLESIDTDEVPDVDFVEVGEVQSLEEEQSSFESVLKSLNQQRVSELEEEPTTIIETEPQKPVSFFSDYDFGDEVTEAEKPTVEEEPAIQEEPISQPKPKFSLDYLFKKPETDKVADETKTPEADESNDDDVDTSMFGDELSLVEEDEDEEPDYSSEDDETEEDEDDSDDSVDTSAFDDDDDDELEEDEDDSDDLVDTSAFYDDEDTELDEDGDDDYDYNSESDDDESVDLSKFEEDDDEEDEDEEPDYSSEDDFEDEEPESDSSVNTIDWDDDELEDEEPDYSSEGEPVITVTSETDIGYLPSVDEVTTEVFNVTSIANKVYEYQQPVKHHKSKDTTISKPVVSHPKPKTTVKPPIYDTEPVDDLVTFTRKRVRVSELDLLKIYSKKELEQALREGKVLRKKGIIIFAHA